MQYVFGFVILLLCPNWAGAENTDSAPPLRLALSAVFLGEQQDLIQRWKHYLERGMQRRVQFIQRRTYQEINELFAQDKLDAGWVCSSSYISNRNMQRLLAVGIWKNKPEYQSYLIVSSQDKNTRSISDLSDKLFAYTDPLSNSGYLVPQSELIDLGVDPAHFFAKTIFTYSHRESIEAVAIGLVNGARVDGYIYDMLAVQRPSLIAKTRIVAKSQSFGFPPIVARRNLPQTDYLRLRDVLTGMEGNPEGRALLVAMGLNRFDHGDDHLYDSVEMIMNKVNLSVIQHVSQAKYTY